jgi:hypothetical protein
MKRRVELEPRIFKPAFGDTMHSSSINDLTIFPKIKEISNSKSKYLRVVSRVSSLILRHIPFLGNALKSRNYISEVIGYDQKLETSDASRMQGYFQTYKYVEKILESQPNFLQFDIESPSNWYLKMKEEIDSKQTVGIHIRGGDYLKDINRDIGSLSSEYYEKAIEMLEKIKHPKDYKIYIFTDDPDYARSLIGSLNLTLNWKLIVPPPESKPTESMLLMSRTDIRIISNSTFAWWAGYLGPEKDSVIAPSKWFREKDDPLYLIPENWKICKSSWTSDKKRDKVIQ